MVHMTNSTISRHKVTSESSHGHQKNSGTFRWNHWKQDIDGQRGRRLLFIVCVVLNVGPFVWDILGWFTKLKLSNRFGLELKHDVLICFEWHVCVFWLLLSNRRLEVPGLRMRLIVLLWSLVKDGSWCPVCCRRKLHVLAGYVFFKNIFVYFLLFFVIFNHVTCMFLEAKYVGTCFGDPFASQVMPSWDVYTKLVLSLTISLLEIVCLRSYCVYISIPTWPSR